MAVIYAFIKGTFKNVQSKLFVRKKSSNHRRNRPHFSANGPFLLLPLALKWGLFLLGFVFVLPCLCSQGVSAASITLSIPGSLSLNVTPTAEGTFVESSPAKITISGADFGYNLSIKSQDGDNTLKGANGFLPSISKSYTVAQGKDGTWPVNTWGYKPSKFNGSANEYYLPGPTKGDVIENLPTAINTNNDYTIRIATRVDNTLAAGTYSNTFIFTVTANKATYTINYNANGGTGDLKPQTGQTETMDLKLSLEEPGSTTKAFEGWCTVQPNGANCSGERYYPGDTYKLKTGNEEVTLYAIWDEPEIMQNWKGCTEDLPINRQISLKDSRDGRLYYVARLADGNCWMTENLDLNIDTGHIYTINDTDLAFASEEDKQKSSDEEGNYQWKPINSTYEPEVTSWNGSTEWSYKPQSYDPGDICWTATRTWGFGTHFVEDTEVCKTHASSHYHLGNYYSYSAAVAQNDTSTHTTPEETYATSICPAGWQLPNVLDKKSWTQLQEDFTGAGSVWSNGYIDEKTERQTTPKVDTVHAYPLYFVYGGMRHASSPIPDHFGFGFHYWYNAISSDTKAYNLVFDGNGGGHLRNPGQTRASGITVRCVKR